MVLMVSAIISLLFSTVVIFLKLPILNISNLPFKSERDPLSECRCVYVHFGVAQISRNWVTAPGGF